jgi:hypothetical protein
MRNTSSNSWGSLTKAKAISRFERPRSAPFRFCLQYRPASPIPQGHFRRSGFGEGRAVQPELLLTVLVHKVAQGTRSILQTLALLELSSYSASLLRKSHGIVCALQGACHLPNQIGLRFHLMTIQDSRGKAMRVKGRALGNRRNPGRTRATCCEIRQRMYFTTATGTVTTIVAC